MLLSSPRMNAYFNIMQRNIFLMISGPRKSCSGSIFGTEFHLTENGESHFVTTYFIFLSNYYIMLLFICNWFHLVKKILWIFKKLISIFHLFYWNWICQKKCSWRGAHFFKIGNCRWYNRWFNSMFHTLILLINIWVLRKLLLPMQ